MVDAPPSEDKLLQLGQRPWEDTYPRVNYTLSRGGYRPYSTTKPKYNAWEPVAKTRGAGGSGGGSGGAEAGRKS